MPGRTLQPGAAALSDKVTAQVPRIFEQAQTSLANHQKNLVALYKLQTEAAQCTEEVRKGRAVRLIGEKIFEEAILHILIRVLPLKKGVTPADRVVKFIGGYVRFGQRQRKGPAEEGQQTVQELLIDIMEHDSSADVRRAAALNLPIDETTISAILDRTRDTDTTIRKLVYSAILEKNVTIGDDDQAMGPTHPRALSIAQRELIIRNGLGDREPSVRAAAASLLGRWVDVIGGKPAPDSEEKRIVKVETGLVQLLKMLDLAEQKYPVDAVLSIFTSRPEIFQTMTFGRDFWENLTPETAFLARVFVEHGLATDDNARLEAVLPVVTDMAFRTQDTFNELTSRIDEEEEARLLTDLTEDEKIRYEDARMEKEAIVGELLQLVVNLDYSDEIGRRKMFQLVRDMLSQEVLPQSLLNKCLDVLRKLSPNERDLIRVLVELVQDLRDRTRGDGEEEDPTKDADAETNFGETPGTVQVRRPNPPREQTAEEKARADAIDLKCLLLCIGMLERVNGTLDENSTLEGILQELIIPSVRRKEYIFREKGLISLGLCCLIAKPLAVNSIKLFVDQVPLSPESLQESLLQVVFDVFMVHEAELRKHRPEIIPYIMGTMLGLLDSAASDKVRALATKRTLPQAHEQSKGMALSTKEVKKEADEEVSFDSIMDGDEQDDDENEEEELLQQAFFLHVLATEPARVLPPHKSLLAMMARAPSAAQPSAIHARVERVVHQAFWDQALQSLSSPSPAVQLPRLKLLYNDLHDALTPLFPPQHPILLTLAAPLSPTSSPLHSTLALLTDVLIALRQRCAPARDTDVDALHAKLVSPLPPSETASVAPENPLAVRIISALRDLISLADVLKRDLTNTLLGAMSEAQLADVIREQAQTRERELVLDPSMWASVDKLKDLWKAWLGSENIWISRLLRALTSPTPVTCQPEGLHPNNLPPQLFFSRPALLYIQNYLQALVISATLNALVPLRTSLSSESPQDFMSRVWTLLKAEVDRDDYTNAKDEQINGDDATKLVNLADEVIRARRLSSTLPVSEPEERKLRMAVERTLQLQDPVFTLLQNRLVRAIDQRIIDHVGRMEQEVNNDKDHGVRIPEMMRTGRVHETLCSSGSRPRCDTPVKRNLPAVVIKGFEDAVLVQAVDEVVDKLLAVVHWVNSVWGDTTYSYVASH
ncbi:hypothetical protein C0992_011749 [Termitomyces sp. T32_za158]|nr:hypothetical protein C0992_011749 [Termitomyces sp. T32_za158]